MKSNVALKFVVAAAMGFSSFLASPALAAQPRAKAKTKYAKVAPKAKPAARPVARRTASDEGSSQSLSGTALPITQEQPTGQQEQQKGKDADKKSVLPYVLLGGAVLIGGVFLATSMSGSKSGPSSPRQPSSPPISNDETKIISEIDPGGDVTPAPTAPPLITPANQVPPPPIDIGVPPDMVTPKVGGKDDGPGAEGADNNDNPKPDVLVGDQPIAPADPTIPKNKGDTPVVANPTPTPTIIDKGADKKDQPVDSKVDPKYIPPKDIPAPAEVAPAAPKKAAVACPANPDKNGIASPTSDGKCPCVNSAESYSNATTQLKSIVDAMGGIDNVMTTWHAEGSIFIFGYSMNIPIRKNPKTGKYESAYTDLKDAKNSKPYLPLTICTKQNEVDVLELTIPQPADEKGVVKVERNWIKPKQVDGVRGFTLMNEEKAKAGWIDFKREDAARGVASAPGGVQ